MRLYVGFTAFQTYIDPADVARLRACIGSLTCGPAETSPRDATTLAYVRM